MEGQWGLCAAAGFEIKAETAELPWWMAKFRKKIWK